MLVAARPRRKGYPMRSTVIVALVFVAALAMGGAARSQIVEHQTPAEIASVRHAISWARGRTWHWQDVARVDRAPTIRGAAGPHSVGYLHWIEKRWNRRRLRAYDRAHLSTSTGAVAHESLWLCIHRGEGAWDDNTGNGYYGGLQMTSGWGGVARPDLLSPTAQMELAEREYRASGYSLSWLLGQWPNTAPPCV